LRDPLVRRKRRHNIHNERNLGDTIIDRLESTKRNDNVTG
jgi:hypothetical protein